MRPNATILILMILAVAGCHSDTPGGIAGKYVGWMWLDDRYAPQDGSMGTTRWIELAADGTYRTHEDTKVMMTYRSEGKGRYTLADGTITIDGSAEVYMDDGYSKGSHPEPQHASFRYTDGMLEERDLKNEPFYYRKEGSGPPPTPSELKVQRSDPSAVAILQQVERTYADLPVYRDSGTMTSHGGGFAAEDVRFTTEFTRPNKLHFACAKFEHGKKYGWADVTWDGRQTLWRSHEYAPSCDRTLSNALGILSVDYGDEADLVPAMLIPKEFNGGAPSSRFKEITRQADETVDGIQCVVLRLRNEEPVASATKLWIDPRTHLILREFEGGRETTVRYSPRLFSTDTSAERQGEKRG